ncbi:RimJ/RimL family protein N-acetyltransferase [Kribbella sp. VKM Ac-2569]|uniref:GNAT family N-acetyltransferase n=1 Tax=Kribbella sp. VKM Ac-2569 TaxID=2512220 RepID=UPI0010F11942|nr:GNAT family N-acetyltransferase [Kribbella sp. VKM Ac-2569]RZT27491.1 RimJ/RimL family protein N-acetyltransferase [Kribbella sp. VKM Ac-2569]
MIATDRLTLLPLEVEYAEPMAEVLSDPALYTFTGGEPPSVAALEARYRRQLAGPGRADEQWLNWVIKYDDGLIGYVQATVIAGTAEIAWVIGTAWQGRGFAKEAAQGMVTWLRAQRIGRIIAHVHPDHTASAAVAAAIGLARTDVLEDGEYLWNTADPA